MSSPEHEEFKTRSRAYRHARANGRKVIRKSVIFASDGQELEGYSVGRVADMLGVTNQTIVNWEKWGWIPKGRSPGRKTRVYTEKQVELIKEFHSSKERGISVQDASAAITPRWDAAASN